MRSSQDVEYDVDDDGGMCYDVAETKSGAKVAKVRVWGHVTISGKKYEYDRHIKVRLKRAK